MFIFDVETLGIESDSVILSFACTHVTDETDDYQKMLDNSIFYKLDIKSQIKLGRTSDVGTCQWWDRQSEIVKQASLYPDSTKDVDPLDALKGFGLWLQKHNFGKDSMFARGALDPMSIDSLSRTFDVSCPVPYNRWYDVRTAIDLTYDNSKYGYVDVDHPTFDVGMVIKHNPVHDCAYDGMMMVYGKK